MNSIDALQEFLCDNGNVQYAVRMLASNVIENNDIMRRQLEEMREDIACLEAEIRYLKSDIKNLNTDSELSNLFKGVL